MRMAAAAAADGASAAAAAAAATAGRASGTVPKRVAVPEWPLAALRMAAAAWHKSTASPVGKWKRRGERLHARQVQGFPWYKSSASPPRPS